MLALIIADDDIHARTKLSNLLVEAGYDVFTTTSAAQTIEVILKNVAKVLILGGRIDGVSALDLIPILKSCSSKIKVILASEGVSAPVLRRLREEGIFYYFLKPVESGDKEEVRSVVECAFRELDMVGPRGSIRMPMPDRLPNPASEADRLTEAAKKRRNP
jgi:DNA-binding NtrC family response regulator